MAGWTATPDSALDEESLALRTLAKAMRRYSVDNKLCKKFKKRYDKT